MLTRRSPRARVTETAALPTPLEDRYGRSEWLFHGMPYADLYAVPMPAPLGGVDEGVVQPMTEWFRRDVLSQLSPLLKVPGEIAMGKSFFSGRNIRGGEVPYAMTQFLPPTGTAMRVFDPQMAEEFGIGTSEAQGRTMGAWLTGTSLIPQDVPRTERAMLGASLEEQEKWLRRARIDAGLDPDSGLPTGPDVQMFQTEE